MGIIFVCGRKFRSRRRPWSSGPQLRDRQHNYEHSFWNAVTSSVQILKWNMIPIRNWRKKNASSRRPPAVPFWYSSQGLKTRRPLPKFRHSAHNPGMHSPWGQNIASWNKSIQKSRYSDASKVLCTGCDVVCSNVCLTFLHAFNQHGVGLKIFTFLQDNISEVSCAAGLVPIFWTLFFFGNYYFLFLLLPLLLLLSLLPLLSLSLLLPLPCFPASGLHCFKCSNIYFAIVAA